MPASSKPWRNAAISGNGSGSPSYKNPIVGAVSCARAATGWTSAALPNSVMNSRRFIDLPRSRADAARLPVLGTHRIGLLHRNRATRAMAALGLGRVKRRQQGP
jgi:hypothetical protein